VIDTVLARDKEFQRWRAEHADSFVPRHMDPRQAPNRAAGRATPRTDVAPVPVGVSRPRE